MGIGGALGSIALRKGLGIGALELPPDIREDGVLAVQLK